MQDYTYTTTGDDAAAAAFMGTFFVGYMIFLIGLYLVTCFILSKVFTKAGKPAWAAFVPIYNGWMLFEIAGKPGWWVLVSLIPFVGPFIAFVLYIIVSLEIAKRFGKSSTFGILALWLFSIIGYAILAFDDSKYKADGSIAAKSSSGKPEALASEANSAKEDDSPTPPPLVQ
ncbi:hypothetical protein A3F64_01430 [Candidatus Saccharibacteria bacterium RIFCSPHIGHO2_12_FULL_42_8]|nr:MAG: hypothetical protein A3F64_01430 [Candidatus Saccharibacteria bacterium RIFCSPHIGHO2_12_FULL_42_8]